MSSQTVDYSFMFKSFYNVQSNTREDVAGLYKDFFAQRLSALRGGKGISARRMSQLLGQADNYINNIENKKTYPSMNGFFNLCDYLGITPGEFFDEGNPYPEKLRLLIREAQKLSESELDTLLALIASMTRGK